MDEFHEGCAIAILSRGGLRKATVERLTPTQLIAATGERFNRKSGRMVGCTDQFFSTSAQLWQEDVHGPRLARLRLRVAQNDIHHEVRAASSRLSMADIEAIRAILAAAMRELQEH